MPTVTLLCHSVQIVAQDSSLSDERLGAVESNFFQPFTRSLLEVVESSTDDYVRSSTPIEWLLGQNQTNFRSWKRFLEENQ